ncbi:MAG: ATP-dependent helicase, partial [Bacteroidia bacterium]
MSHFLEDLNLTQREAAMQIDGPVMIIAGAGSGKTRVLTYRIAHILNQGADPFQILALTFTNKAAREMKTRIGLLVNESYARQLWMGTFHSVFARILRVEAEKIGYPKQFTIYDTEDSKSVLKTIVKELQLDDKIYKPSLLLNRISDAKNKLINATQYQENPVHLTEDTQSKKPLLGQIYALYEKRNFRAGAMDFDDLLFQTNILLRDNPEVLLKYQEQFRYILVDEYQDTNFSQYLIIKQLAARFENICVVGDDAQSIYAFRGANIQNILNFKSDYPEARIFKLEQNYRSTVTIVESANAVISQNQDQLPKTVFTKNGTGAPILVFRAGSDSEEGQRIAHYIQDRSKHGVALHDMAILYRTNAQSRAFEEWLRRLHIPYKIYGGISFYQRK